MLNKLVNGWDGPDRSNQQDLPDEAPFSAGYKYLIIM
jgi:hypothetical protein